MSSSFDSALVDTATIEDPRLVVLPRGVRLLAVEALVWAKLHRTDGFLPRAAVPRMTDEPGPWQAADRLAEAGVWESTDDGWQIAGFTEMQMSAARVKEKQAAAKIRYDRWQQSHGGGKRVGNGVTNDSARPAPPAFKGKGQVGGSVAAGQEAAAAALEVVQLSPGVTDTVDCSDYSGHRSRHRHFSEGGWRCDLCDRRRLAASIREADPAYKPRLLRAWQSSYGHLYQKVATA